MAVLDQLSGGRVLLGVGRGYAPEMLRAFHVPVAEKRRIFAWTLDLMQQAWQGEAISLDGNPDNAVKVYPVPVQQPYPPIWVAAFGPKALAQAGRMGLPYLSSPMEGIRTLADNYTQHRQASVEEGVSPADIVPVMRTVYVSDDAAEVAELRQRVDSETENSRLQPGEGVDETTLLLHGFLSPERQDPRVRQLRRCVRAPPTIPDRDGVSHVAVRLLSALADARAGQWYITFDVLWTIDARSRAREGHFA